MIMIVLNLNSPQTFSIIPKTQADPNEYGMFMYFTNETTKEVFAREVTVFSNVKDVFLIGSSDFTFLRVNNFYSLEVRFGYTNEIIYKDIVFCTTQPIETFTINEGNYVLPQIDNNSYITI